MNNGNPDKPVIPPVIKASPMRKTNDARNAMPSFKSANIDALVVAGPKRLAVYTEQSADKIYRVLIEKMHEGAVTLDRDGSILYCNKSFARIVGTPLNKVIGSVFMDFIDGSFKNRVKTILKDGRKHFIKEELSMLALSGKIIPVLISLNSFSLDGLNVLSIVVTDLTTHNKSREGLRSKSMELKQANAKLTEANESLTYQNKKQQKQALKLVKLSENLKGQQSNLKKANAALRANALLLRQQEKKVALMNDGLLQLNKSLEKRVLERTMELQSINAELKELNLSKDKFLFVISHDLRNPLAAMLMSAGMLTEKAQNEAFLEIRPLVKIIHNTSSRVLQQLNDLVKWAQAQQDKAAFKPERINLSMAVDKSFGLLKEFAAQKQIALQNRSPQNISITADNRMLRSILQNLVTNAIKYTPHGGKVVVSGSRKSGITEVSVSDSGIGMEENARKNLFDNKHIVSSSGTDNESGYGMGLMLVKGFIAQHGGSIRVESKLGVGTRLIFTLSKVDAPLQ